MRATPRPLICGSKAHAERRIPTSYVGPRPMHSAGFSPAAALSFFARLAQAPPEMELIGKMRWVCIKKKGKDEMGLTWEGLSWLRLLITSLVGCSIAASGEGSRSEMELSCWLLPCAPSTPPF